jgi:energy-coupling factor transporter transmembrane protein EcfT
VSRAETLAEPAARPAKVRRATEMTFLRLVPGTSVVHRLWAGTKILVAAELALMLSIAPTWPMVGVTAAVVLVELLVARIPLGAFPRLPNWIFLFLVVSALLSMLSSVKPVFDVGGITLSLGALNQWALFTTLAVVLVVSGAVVGWTTPLGDVAPALEKLFRPLRWLRLPIDEWIIAIGLAIRCLPLLIDEIRTLAAARKLRADDEQEREGRETPRAAFRAVLEETHDLMATAIVVSIRRARDLADAIVARGGLGAATSLPGARFGVVDVLVLCVTTALCVVTLAVLHL